MNPLPDAFEMALVRKVFIWICMFFFILFGASAIVELSYARDMFSAKGTIIFLRILLLVLNGSALLLVLRLKATDASFLRLPPLVIMANLTLSFSIIIATRGSLLVQMVSFLITAILYLMISGLFFQFHTNILIFGMVLIGIAVLLFETFPDLIFSQVLDVEELYTALRFTLHFGLISTTVLVFINSKIASTVLGHTRDYADQLKSLAFFDQETGLPNGLQLEQDIRDWEEVHRAPLSERMVMVGFRLDGLEALNETDGVEFTNSLLRDIVRLYQSELERISDKNPESGIPENFKTLYRVESNSFIFIMNRPQIAVVPATTKPLLADIIQKLLAEHHGKVLLTFHGGFTYFPEEAQTLQQLLRNLLNLLHTYKAENNGQFVAFNPELYQDYLRQESIRIELLKAVQENTFALAFQPRVDVKSGRTMGFEALARWENPSLGKISPSEFIPLVEKFALIQTLTLQLLEKAFDFIRELYSAGLSDLRVSLNLSPGILNSSFLDQLIRRVEESGLGSSLELEITEGLLMKLDSVVSSAFSRLKQLDVGFSIDDFGTGYSNLGYLQSFEAEILKIDKRFIDGTPLDRKNSKLVMAILQMARSFNMTVVAEGVEYKEQRDFLLDNGCEQIQGFYYSRPLQARDALDFASKTTID